MIQPLQGPQCSISVACEISQKTDISCEISVAGPLDSTSPASFYLLIHIKSKGGVSLTVSSIFLEMKLLARQIKNLTHTPLLER